MFDVPLVFLEGGGANHPHIATRECWLQHIGCIHRAFGSTGSHDGMHFVDKKNDFAIGALYFFHYGLESLFKLTAVFGTSDEESEIKLNYFLATQRFWHVSCRDAVGEAFGDSGLAHAWLTNQNRIVFGATRENLDDADDFAIATDHGVELVFACTVGE